MKAEGINSQFSISNNVVKQGNLLPSGSVMPAHVGIYLF
jgi:hypothetical protein